jgi:predicted transposase/invertase (TIGR01784 family)
MSKKKKSVEIPPPVDFREFLHQPHDRYVRALLQYKVSALQIMEYSLGKEASSMLDFESFELTNASFLDEKLQLSLADICYEGKFNNGSSLRVCMLFEHKSEPPSVHIYEQLNRYISNIWVEDQKQGRSYTLSIPILIYHGDTPIKQVTPEHLFPDAPAFFLKYVPRFEYVILDLASHTDEDIEQMDYDMLKNVFLALKHSRDEVYLDIYWKKVVIFASHFKDDRTANYIIETTLTYMVNVSKTIQTKLENINSFTTPDEAEMVLPYVFQKYINEGKVQGMEEGMIRMIHAYIQKNPTHTDAEIAAFFDIDINLVKKARKS